MRLVEGPNGNQNPSYDAPPPNLPTGGHLTAQEDARDAYNLGVLSILTYIYGGFICLIGLSLIGPAIQGLQMASAFRQNPPDPVMTLVAGLGYLSVVLVLFFFGWGIINLVAANMLQKRRNRGLVMTAAILDCLQIPLGTILGIFVLIAICRPSTRATFDKPRI